MIASAPVPSNVVVTPLPPALGEDEEIVHDWRCTSCARPEFDSDIAALERALAFVTDATGRPLYTGPIDGIYGRRLNQAVGAYQRAMGLNTRDGDVYNREMYVSLSSTLRVASWNNQNPTVEVPELFSVERYPTVWQMTSLVTARSTATLRKS